MRPDRRLLLARTAPLLAGALLAGGCAPERPAPVARGPLDPRRLGQGLTPIAMAARPGILDLGVAAIGTSDAWFADQAGRYPMAGASRLPIAAAALAERDAGRLRLSEAIRIGPEDLSTPPSRINDAVLSRGGPLFLPLADLVALAIRRGDATAADALMRRLGGPAAVGAWLGSKGLAGMRIDRYDRDRLAEMFAIGPFRPEWAREGPWQAAREARSPQARQAAMDNYLADLRDTSTARAAVALLAELAEGSLLGKASTAFLLRLMADAATDGGLAAGLPPGTAVARLAAAAPTEIGFTAAADELAIVALPGGGPRLAVAVFLAGSTASAGERRALFGRVGALLDRATRR